MIDDKPMQYANSELNRMLEVKYTELNPQEYIEWRDSKEAARARRMHMLLVRVIKKRERKKKGLSNE